MIWCRRKIDKQVQVFQSDEQSLYHVQNMKWGVILIHSVTDVITKGLFASPVTSQQLNVDVFRTLWEQTYMFYWDSLAYDLFSC